MKLDKNSPVPLYIQFKELLLAKIESGEWRPQQKLPSERTLCNEYDISRITVREAIKELVRDGLVESVPGKGSFVRHKTVAEYKPINSFTVATQMQGQVPSSRLINQEIIYAATGLVRELEIPLNTKVLMIHRVRLADGEPRVIQKAFVPLSFCPTLLDHDFEKESLYQALETECQLVLAKVKSSFEARLADEMEAQMLKLTPPTAVLVTRQTNYLANGRPVEYCRSVYRANERFYLS
ncbi:GntR family transcriptional regulator [Candidatus Leptofilum sp.]|uniref:GntR family transcriptional regulator n=1 Tax=Candidatus Leptofilum sp. TaxID=3241576 RepID=UPI003B5B4056